MGQFSPEIPLPMKRLQHLVVLFLALALAPMLCHAAEGQAASSASWHSSSIGMAIAYMLLWALVGVLAAIGGYILFDKFTPGDLHGEIIRNKNVAAAILGGAMILGTCVIVAAAMLG